MDEKLKLEISSIVRSELLAVIKAEVRKAVRNLDKKNPFLFTPTEMADILECSVPRIHQIKNERHILPSFKMPGRKKVLYDIREFISKEELELLNLGGE